MRYLLAMLLFSVPALADVRFAVGSFVQGATSITTADGAGAFAPKAIVIVITSHTAPGSLATVRQSIGFCSSNGPTRISSQGEANDTGGSTGNTSDRRVTTGDRCTILYEGLTVVYAAIITFTGTGFTYANNANDAGNRIVNFIAVGGSDITTKVGQVAAPASPGSVTTTVGFPPTIVFFLASAPPANYPPGTNLNLDVSLGVGLGTSPSTAGGFSGQSDSGVATSVATSVLTGKSIQFSSSTSGATFWAADITAMDATSFTTDFTTSAGAGSMGYLAIGGGAWAVGHANQPTSTGDQALTTTGMYPIGALFFSANKVTSATYTTGARLSLGATDGSNTFNTFWGRKGAATVQVATTSMDQTNALRMMTEGGASPTTSATMDTVAFGPNTLTPHWFAVDATAREYVWIAFGAAGTVTPAALKGSGFRR